MYRILVYRLRHWKERYWDSSCRDNEELPVVTIGEVERLIRSLPAKSSPVNFMPTTMLKSSVDVMAPLITRLANMSFSAGVFLVRCTIVHVLEKLALRRLWPDTMLTGRPGGCQTNNLTNTNVTFSLHTELDIQLKQHCWRLRWAAARRCRHWTVFTSQLHVWRTTGQCAPRSIAVHHVQWWAQTFYFKFNFN